MRLVVLMMLFWFSNEPDSMASAFDSGEPLITADETGLTVSWVPPQPSITTIEIDGDLFSQIQVSGTSLLGWPGAPQLPLFAGLVGLPPTGGAQLRIVEVEEDKIVLPHPPLPATVPEAVYATPDSPPVGISGRRTPDPAIYAANADYPDTVADLGPIQHLRHHRLARLRIHPVRVNPVTRQMTVVRSLKLEIRFDQPVPENELIVQDRSDVFDQGLVTTLLNPASVKYTRYTSALSGQDIGVLQSGTSLIKLVVEQAGLYELSYSMLKQAGVPVDTLDPRRLQLTHGWPRQGMAILVDGEADGQFDPDDRLLFYAEPTFSRFTNEQVYFLTYEQTIGLRMATRSAEPNGLQPGTAWRTTISEINQHYAPKYADHNGDYWYWTELRQPDQTSANFSMQLGSPLSTGPDAGLTVWLQGYTNVGQNPDHRVGVSINGWPLGEYSWDGDQAVALNFTVPANRLESGANSVNLTLPGLNGVSVEGTWVDAFKLIYPTGRGSASQLIFDGETGQRAYTLSGWTTSDISVFNITNPNTPEFLTGFQLAATGGTFNLSFGDTGPAASRYLVVPNNLIKQPARLEPVMALADPPAGADYIIISHPDFRDAVAPLAAHRAAQGLRVVTVDVRAIYDTYGEGRMDPAAIKTFLQHSFSNWTPPAPTYVLLVGDGSYDLKNYSGYNPTTYIPPFMADVDPWWGETAADNRFVTLVGSDTLPDMLIGRLPVNSFAEAQTVVDKIVRYETDPAPGNWNGRHLFVTDNPDRAGDFHSHADEGYIRVTSPFLGYRYYYGEDSGTEPHIYADADTLRASFVNSLNQGAGFLTFHGHSSWLQWATEGILRLYPDPPFPASYPNDLLLFQNQIRLPVVLEMTCFTASFHRPEYTTLDEGMLTMAGGGALAVWGSTGLGLATGHTRLQSGFYDALNQGETTLGALTLAGKTNLYSSGIYLDLLDTFILLGDPATQLNLALTPFSNSLYLPVIQR